MARQYAVIVEWGTEGEPGWERQDFECRNYAVSSDANLLTMRDVIFGTSGRAHVVGIPLHGARRYVVTDRHLTPVRQ